MGFSCAAYNVKKIANNLNLDEGTVFDAMRRSRYGGYAKVWEFNDKGNFGNGRVSVAARKDSKDANSELVTQFQDGFVCFSGKAYDRIKSLTIPKEGLSIVILSCDVRTVKKGDKMYTNFYIFDFDVYESSHSGNAPRSTATSTPARKTPPQSPIIDDTDDLPF